MAALKYSLRNVRTDVTQDLVVDFPYMQSICRVSRFTGTANMPKYKESYQVLIVFQYSGKMSLSLFITSKGTILKDEKKINV